VRNASPERARGSFPFNARTTTDVVAVASIVTRASANTLSAGEDNAFFTAAADE
jgi:hypothetical protein